MIIMLHIGGGTLFYSPSGLDGWTSDRSQAKEFSAEVADSFSKVLQERRNDLASHMRYVNGEFLTDEHMRREAGLVRVSQL